MKIFSGTANQPLAQAICKSIGCELGRCNIIPFPDGETFVKIEENVRGEDVFIVQPTSPPTNHNLMEMFIMIDAVRRASATRITTVLPFYGYARQDRKDQPRVPITAKLVANLLVAAGGGALAARTGGTLIGQLRRLQTHAQAIGRGDFGHVAESAGIGDCPKLHIVEVARDRCHGRGVRV